MATVTSFRTPEEAALELELPLLGILGSPPESNAPVAATWPADDAAKREAARVAERILGSATGREGRLGILGDVSAERRARIASTLASAFASERTTVLVDADLRHAYLSFDDRRRAQEGLVDVLRYGVRSPRVVAPTLTPGLTLLPVGSRTVDLAGTFNVDAVPGLFAELRRSSDVVLVNGPDLADADAATRLLDEVGAWILVHELGVSDAERTRALRDRLGRSSCLGVLALGDRSAIPSQPIRSEVELESSMKDAPAVVAAPVRAPHVEAGTLDAVERAMEAADSEAEPALPEPEERIAGPVGRRRLGLIVAGVAAVAVTAVVAWVMRPDRGPVAGGSGADETPAGSALVPGGTNVAPPPESGDSPAVEPGPPATDLLPAPDAGSEIAGISPGEVDASGAAEEPAPGTTPGVSPGTTDATPAGPDAGRIAEAGSAGSVAPSQAPAPTALTGTATPPAVTPPAATQTPPPSPALGPVVYSVHVSSVKSRAGAERDVEVYGTSANRPAFLKRVEIPDKGTWWRVYVGPFATRDEADRVAAELHKAGREYAQVHRMARSEIEGTGREE